MMNLFDLDDRVTAAAVAAAGTVIGAVIQLRVAWRKEVSERARGVPMTKKARKGPVLAVFLLVAAAALGGFAFSQYLAVQAERDTAALRGEMHTQLAQISATAERLERATENRRAAADMEDRRPQDSADVTVTATIGPCRTHADSSPACTEREALQVTLCGSIPASTTVAALTLYARPENSPRPWTESQLAPGQEAGQARFSDKSLERAESDQVKQVCTVFASWNAEQAYSARMVVKYTAPPPLREVSQSAIVPVADLH
jgi:hypothetical protein